MDRERCRSGARQCPDARASRDQSCGNGAAAGPTQARRPPARCRASTWSKRPPGPLAKPAADRTRRPPARRARRPAAWTHRSFEPATPLPSQVVRRPRVASRRSRTGAAARTGPAGLTGRACHPPRRRSAVGLAVNEQRRDGCRLGQQRLGHQHLLKVERVLDPGHPRRPGSGWRPSARPRRPRGPLVHDDRDLHGVDRPCGQAVHVRLLKVEPVEEARAS